MVTYSFENLTVWKESKMLAIFVYTFTKSFPAEEKYGMTTQLRRAATSICSNIAEGSGRRTAKDQAHFFIMAFGSLMELLSESLISSELNWISGENLIAMRSKVESISLKLRNLIRAALDRTSSPN
jgi:four helix bundle protein